LDNNSSIVTLAGAEIGLVSLTNCSVEQASPGSVGCIKAVSVLIPQFF